MKPFKRILSIMLATLLLCSAALPVFADSELVTKAEMCYTIPTVGEKAGSLHLESADPDKYLVSVKEIYYRPTDENGNPAKDDKGNPLFCILTNDDVFAEGVYYRIRIEFLPRAGYKLDDSQTTFIINSRENKSSVGRWTREDVFKPKAQTAQDDAEPGGCPYCHKDHQGFLSFLVTIFHKILFRLFGEKK